MAEIKTEKSNSKSDIVEAMDMGAFYLSRRRHSLYDCHDGERGLLQTAGAYQHSNRSLHELALPSLGDKTVMEPVR